MQASSWRVNGAMKWEVKGDSLPFPVSALRLHHLESRVIEDVGKTPDIVCELKNQVESFKRKLEVPKSLKFHQEII